MTQGNEQFNLPVLYSNLDHYLLQAQQALESAIEAYGKAGDHHATKHAEYRRAKASAIKQLKEEKNPATLIGDLAQGQVADLKEIELKALYDMNRCKMAVASIEERINMLKYIGRSCDNTGASNPQR